MATKDYIPRTGKYRGLTLMVMGLTAIAILVMANEFPLLVRAANVYATEGAGGVVDRVRSYSHLLVDSPVEWPSATPESYGLDNAKLEQLAVQLSEQQTNAFLIVKESHLVYEWYAEGYRAEKKLPTAALAKPITGSVALMAAIDDGRIRLDDPAWKYIPEWRDHPQKAKITIRQLGSHRSGLDDVVFRDDVSPDWKLAYYQHPDRRFSLALSVAPLMFEPGTRTVYSGVGYYVLAYALARSLQGTSEPDAHQFLTRRIMDPLQIPPEAWDISYGNSYQLDGMELYAIGSGGNYTARAVARIGQFMLNQGKWSGKQLVKPSTVSEILGYSSSEEESTFEAAPIGWVTNADGRSPSLPQDAFWGLGKGDQVLLVIPSLSIVMVRMGGALSPESATGTDNYESLERNLFIPLMAAIK